jgi:hypothetical protein
MNISTLLLLFAIFSVALCERIALNVNSAKAMKAAEFALSELTKLSDSGVYQSLSLQELTKAEEEVGIFHYNTILSMKLHSPYFKSGEEVEEFHMVVMEHKTDRVKSFAIDEFPVMDDDAIEKFWIQKVEVKRRQREEAYRRLEIESLTIKNAENKAKYEREDIETVFVDIDQGTYASEDGTTTHFEMRKQRYQASYEAKSPGSVTIYDEIEHILSRKSLLDLYLLSLGGFQPIEAKYEHTADTNMVVNIHYQLEQKGFVIPPLTTDFIYYKAQLMLDDAMQELF